MNSPIFFKLDYEALGQNLLGLNSCTAEEHNYIETTKKDYTLFLLVEGFKSFVWGYFHTCTMYIICTPVCAVQCTNGDVDRILKVLAENCV